MRNSLQNADVAFASAHQVRVTHPFHPFSGQSGVCVGERHNRHGRRLLLRFDDGAVCSVPPQWTDAIPPDPEIVIGQSRALFRVSDLMELAGVVARMIPPRSGVV